MAPHADAHTDLTQSGRERILSAAIEAFGERGIDGTSLKVIAEAAGVSQALIVHHFGSKEGLRAACDEYVAATIRANKHSALSQGARMDLLAVLREGTYPGALRYLARTVRDGTPQLAALLDELVDDAMEYMAAGERAGTVKPSEWPRERVVILVLWSLGLLALHEHAARLLGTDLFGEPEQLGPYLVPTTEILSRGVVADEMYEQVRDAFARLAEESAEQAGGQAAGQTAERTAEQDGA